jgi:hypothetical protein
MLVLFFCSLQITLPQVMHTAFKRCDHAEVKTTGEDHKVLSLKHFGFPLAVLGNKKLIRPTNQVILRTFILAFQVFCSPIVLYYRSTL